mmetsp:Transcript_19722/g.35023  ORF Transcript_19722/g.35023 Transcript_19722/m.35023 type:complete len:439 (+) Transcript_19722:53-1369(+)|eukprot:CAMPEP_0197658282 /NCGR_PEP_ID=MMETSP1338-20131121/45142_1 /TAXON_ID=43686 ORGANISM="Pelagodinium beii, Strain RCC1491" /NCGR_SAMPLE_ID=MMETSP1338 /ASSEMBLY_ACC=CAM_ASM_000754 /LENGTH=438 /DNA_ID=CAMNT_0043234841 /DNA_START=21 /DNA_END=1337 /DNA_ORIENTATION=-
MGEELQLPPEAAASGESNPPEEAAAHEDVPEAPANGESNPPQEAFLDEITPPEANIGYAESMPPDAVAEHLERVLESKPPEAETGYLQSKPPEAAAELESKLPAVGRDIGALMQKDNMALEVDAAVPADLPRVKHTAREWRVVLHRLCGCRTGLAVVLIPAEDQDVGKLQITGIAEGSALYWNESMPDASIKAGDFIVAVNDISGDEEEMATELRSASIVYLRVQEGSKDGPIRRPEMVALASKSHGDRMRIAEKEAKEACSQGRCIGMANITRTDGPVEDRFWEAASEWSLCGIHMTEECKFIEAFGFRAATKEKWGQEPAKAVLELELDNHIEQVGHTWYLIRCRLLLGTQDELQWTAPRRLQQLRSDLHDVLQADFRANLGVPFALTGGPKGTTARLKAWLKALAVAVKNREVSPELTAHVLMFLGAPLPAAQLK